jgi:hypothetical protein
LPGIEPGISGSAKNDFFRPRFLSFSLRIPRLRGSSEKTQEPRSKKHFIGRWFDSGFFAPCQGSNPESRVPPKISGSRKRERVPYAGLARIHSQQSRRTV